MRDAGLLVLQAMQPEDVYMVSLHLTIMVVAQLLLQQLKNSLNQAAIHMDACTRQSLPAAQLPRRGAKIIVEAAREIAVDVMAKTKC